MRLRTDLGEGGVIDGILNEIELATLLVGAEICSTAGGADTGLVFGGDERNLAHTAGDQRLEEVAPMELGL